LPGEEAGREAEEERPRFSEEVDEDDVRRQLAASLLQRETGLKLAFASFAKTWEKKKKRKEEEEKKTPTAAKVAKVIIPFKALARLARSVARGIYGGLTSRLPALAGKKREVCDEDSDDDPAKKSGPGKILEEGTARPCGEEGEEEGWSEDAVEWCGVRYAKGDLPPFDTTGLRDKMAFNPNHALWLATAAALAYRSPRQIRHVVTRIWLWEDMKFFHDAATDTQGFGMYGKECIVICFRGTESFTDWSINAKVVMSAPFPDLRNVKVHRGFNTAFLSVWDQVVAFINKARSANPALPLFITGHSLGGALANLCLAYLIFPSPYPLPLPVGARQGEQMERTSAEDDSGSGSSSSTSEEWVPLVNGVYTFGQPKVGNRQFGSELRARTAARVAFFRLTNDNDFVPFLPRRPAFVHCGTRLFLSHGHIVQGEEFSQFVRHLFRMTSSKRMMKRKQQGMHDHIVRSYLAFLREHYRLNEFILLSSGKDAPLLHFHDLERAKQLRDELKNLGDFDEVMKRLKQMTLCELIELRSVTLTVKQRKRENRLLGSRWIRDNLWELLQYSEREQIQKINRIRDSSSASATSV
jgi:triacylglycerol lipase